jgi:predicted anti-sigma-YlaC factor YlaD
MIRWITCREFVQFLDDYLEGRLAGVQLEEFNNHLSGCPSCVIYLRTYRDSVKLAKAVVGEADALPESVPEDLVTAILAARRKGSE